MKLQQLLESRNKAVAAARAFLDSRTDDKMSAEDAATYDKMESDITALTKAIDAENRMAAIEGGLSQNTTVPIADGIVGQSDSGDKRATAEYSRDFVQAMRTKKVTDLLQTGVDADGGYIVPEELERELVQGLCEANVIRSLAKVITTSSERKIPIVASTTTATWVAENGAIPESNMKFDQKSIDAYKLTNLVRVSTELLQDAFFDLPSYLTTEFARALGVAEEQAFCVGSGSGQPTGIFVATGGGEIGVTAGSATAITLDNVLDLIYSLKAPYRSKAKFLMHDGTVAALRKLKDGNGQYLWQPSLQAGEPDKLMGYALYTTPYAPAIAAGALPVAFGDFKNYWIADRKGRSVQRLDELYATNGQVGFLATQRVDAKVILPEGIKLLRMG